MIYDGSFELSFLLRDERVSSAGDGTGAVMITCLSERFEPVRVEKGDRVSRNSRGDVVVTRSAGTKTSPGHDPTGAVTPVGEPTSTASRVDERDDPDGAVTPSGEPTAAVPSCGGRERGPDQQQPANADYPLGSSRDVKSGAAVGEQGTGEPGGVVGAAGPPPHGRFRHAVARVALAVYYWGIRSPRKGTADRAEYIRVLTLTVAYQAAWAARHGINFRTFVAEVYAALDEYRGSDA